MKMRLSYLIIVLLLPSAVCLAVEQEIPRLTQATGRPIAPTLIQRLTYKSGPVIPGLREGAIPQGLAYSKKHNTILVSHYFKKTWPSCVSLIDHGSGKLVHVRALKESDDSFHFGHVGGIAVDPNSAWIASEGYVYQYRIMDLLGGKEHAPPVTPIRHKVETQASFCTYHNGIVFVGEFAFGKRYPTDVSHHLEDRKQVRKYAWVCGYETDKGFAAPTLILSIGQKVQSMHIDNEHIFLSISYGRRNSSAIEVYKNPLSEPPHKRVELKEGIVVPLWFLDEGNLLKSIDFAPMSEGLTDIDGELAVLCESGASKYLKGGKGPVDTIILLDKKELLDRKPE
ncbi:MAG: hypothetical protein JW860_15385 [Sedimentisphaerales bacterium]|nr:hypothetical protein [Sedimentisphaerales bacterium]